MSERKEKILNILHEEEKASRALKGDFAWQAIGLNAGDDALKQDLIIKAHTYNAKEEAFRSASRIIVENL